MAKGSFGAAPPFGVIGATAGIGPMRALATGEIRRIIALSGGRIGAVMKYFLIVLAFLVPTILLTVAIDEWVVGKWSVLARSFVLFAAIFGSSFCVRKIAGMPVDGIIKGVPLFLVIFIAVSAVYLLL